MTLLKTLSTLFFLVIITEVTAAEKPDLQGSWKSVGPESFHNGRYGTRIMEVNRTSWKEILIVYRDMQLTKPVYKIETRGVFDLNSPHSSMFQTWEINFHPSSRTFTLLSDDREVIRDLELKSCARKKDEAIDISENGCGKIPGVRESSVIYQIVKREFNLMFMGNMTVEAAAVTPEERPNQFGYPLRKFDPKTESNWVSHRAYLYSVFHIKIKNKKTYQAYEEGFLESVHRYGGRELVLSREAKSVDGSTASRLMTILLWPDEEQFNKWWKSESFTEWKNMLEKGTDFDLVLTSEQYPGSYEEDY